MSSIYTEKWVLFLDILGFEAIINNKEDGYKESEEFAEIVLQVFNRILEHSDAYKEHELFKKTSISQFSDTFIISADDLNHITFLASQLMMLFLACGLLSRGAITYGKVFHNGSQFIGPAITRAYNLEKSKALYPRVIIDPECEDSSGKILILKVFHHLHKDSDGYLYVNFLNIFNLNDDYHSNSMTNYKEIYKMLHGDDPDCIMSNINALYEKHKNTKHRGKYTWLKQKADEFVQNTK